jgi:uncharacterized membrane protein YkvA (DUF1232 family)
MLKSVNWITKIKEPYALFLMIRDPRTARQAKLYAFAITGLILIYIISPIDIVPDTIPLLGWMDDLLLIPLGLSLIERLLPAQILAEKRAIAGKNVNRVLLTALLVILTIVLLWTAGITALVIIMVKLLNG